jgi:hypothetical protein
MPEKQSLKNKPLPKPRRARAGRHWKTGRKPMTRLQLAKLLELTGSPYRTELYKGTKAVVARDAGGRVMSRLTGRSWRDVARQLNLV